MSTSPKNNFTGAEQTWAKKVGLSEKAERETNPLSVPISRPVLLKNTGLLEKSRALD